MQFGRSPRVLQVGCAVLVAMLGAGRGSAQISQVLGGTGGQQQQQACNPTDPGCQSVDQIRSPSQTNVQPTSTTQGIVLQSDQTNQNNTNAQTSNQQQQGQNLTTVEPKLPLDSPTEFQNMVANATGTMLPIYGAKLFRNPPSTFAPLNMVPVTPDYVVGPGDELQVQLWGQVTLNGRFMVDRMGNVYIPQVGTLHVAGLRFMQLQDSLKTQIGRVFRNFDLNVNMGQLRSIQVFVVGQARRPGNYTISSLSTLVNALFVTGGPTPQGSVRHIQLKRAGQVIVDFDLYDLLLHGDKSKDVQLLPGDVIFIPSVGPQVALTGSVNGPAIYELKSGGSTTVGEMIELAGGLTNVAASEKIRLERVSEGRGRSFLELGIDAKGKATVLQDGDILSMIAIPNQYKDAVTLRGNVANPGRYTWKPGMRVKDLIPDKDALITRDYWLKRAQLGQPGLTFIPTCPPRTPFGIPSLRYGIPVGEEGDNPNWRYSSTRNPNLFGLPFGNLEGTSTQMTDGPTTDGGPDCGIPNESQTSASGMNDRYTPSAQAQTQGAVPTQGTTNPTTTTQSVPQFPQNTAGSNRVSTAEASVGASSTQFRARFDVKLSEPDINWSYAVIERQGKEDLTTTLLPFNLGKVVMQGDVSQNLELEPGDVVTIFSKADIHVPQAEQTRLVRLEGEFVGSGVYSVKPGETLRQLVQRAGGLTPEAYLYGSEFTRESTRRVQQQRLNEYVDQISLQASANAAGNANRSISAQDSAAASAAAQQNQNIVNSLRQARATGRIVLEMPPDSRDVAALPDLPLEDGDRFIVPRVPSTVSVDGAVYNQNTFLYDPRRRVGDYVRLAGGANRDADANRAYVIRAGGSVVSRQYSSTLLRGNGFDSLRLYPGDTVVIPMNLDKGRGMRLLVDIAQIVGQFGIAIAATNTLF
jgi:protein involved in polysaccharide export with SLBB domain